MNARDKTLPVAVIGAGPVGLAAAAHLSDREIPFDVYEAGASVGENLLSYSHVRLFSPWRFDVDRAAVKILKDEGWRTPAEDELPAAGDLVRKYLEPLADTRPLAGRIHYNQRVVAVSRLRYDKVKSAGREQVPFILHVQSNGTIEEHLASAVIDASGTWSRANPLGGNGLRCPGERDNRDRIFYGMPDIPGSARGRYAGRKVLVVGAGHSAAGNLIALAELATAAPGTRIAWAVRGSDVRRIFGGGEKDGLPARGALGLQLQRLVAEGRVELHLGFHLRRIERSGDRLRVFTGDATACFDEFDEIIVATGSRPDLEITRELRLRLDPWLESTDALAPLIDPNVHSCGTVRPHGHRELEHPEIAYYAIGAKSYGRAPNFLMATGYEQARSVVAALAGDMAAADDVQLELPETGVCSSDLQFDGQKASAAGCCGGLAKPPESTCCAVEESREPVSAPTGGCCGSPEARLKPSVDVGNQGVDGGAAAGNQMAKTLNVLFLCTGNSARSILAEAYLNANARGRFRAFSAGSHPSGQVNPLALDLLAKNRISIEGMRSKSWDEFASPGAPSLDFIFTVCDNAAGETCPYWPGQPFTAHWGVPDPAAVEGSDEDKRRAFQRVFVQLSNRIDLFLALPIESLEHQALIAKLRTIGTAEAS